MAILLGLEGRLLRFGCEMWPPLLEQLNDDWQEWLSAKEFPAGVLSVQVMGLLELWAD